MIIIQRMKHNMTCLPIRPLRGKDAGYVHFFSAPFLLLCMLTFIFIEWRIILHKVRLMRYLRLVAVFNTVKQYSPWHQMLDITSLGLDRLLHWFFYTACFIICLLVYHNLPAWWLAIVPYCPDFQAVVGQVLSYVLPFHWAVDHPALHCHDPMLCIGTVAYVSCSLADSPDGSMITYSSLQLQEYFCTDTATSTEDLDVCFLQTWRELHSFPLACNVSCHTAESSLHHKTSARRHYWDRYPRPFIFLVNEKTWSESPTPLSTQQISPYTCGVRTVTIFTNVHENSQMHRTRFTFVFLMHT